MAPELCTGKGKDCSLERSAEKTQHETGKIPRTDALLTSQGSLSYIVFHFFPLFYPPKSLGTKIEVVEGVVEGVVEDLRFPFMVS